MKDSNEEKFYDDILSIFHGMHMNDLISVVLASYNGERYISHQLDSILAQSYPNIEIICIDDNSTDNTVQIIKVYQEKHQNTISFYQNETNTGSRKAFEKGVSLAMGKYIAFADQDDYWFPNKLEELYGAIKQSERIAFVYSNSELVDKDLNVIKSKTWSDNTNFISGFSFYQILVENTIMGCSMLVNSEFAKKCIPFPTAGLHHDWYLALMALGTNLQILYVNKVLFKYRRHDNNQVNKESKGRSSNTAQYRALRTYKEVSAIDQNKLSNVPFKKLIQLKKELFRNLLTKHPINAFISWRKYYTLLSKLNAVNLQVKRSNFRYILYCLKWKKLSEEELV
jgi:glycosyltransferase involved in cell wall biosynthesis